MATLSEALRIAIAHHQAGRADLAEQIYRRVLQVEPEHADALHLLGVIVLDAGQPAVAVDYIRRAIDRNPAVAAFHNNLGEAYRALGRDAEAADCYRRAVELVPEYAEAYNNLGNALQRLGDSRQAAACYRRALKTKPGLVGAYNNLGNALQDLGELDEAIACHRRALERVPDDVEALNSLGVALRSQGKFDEAVACCERCLEIQPEFASAHWNRSLVWLLRGDLARGWQEYEWRWRRKQARPMHLAQPLWDGRPLPAGTILLRAEQGLGDTIQFIRYAAWVKQRVGRVILECHPPLVRLLARCPGIDQIVAQGGALPVFSVYAPLLSLPRISGTVLENIPADVPYLRVDPELAARWRKRLAGYEGFKVGIAWQGSRTYHGDRFRSIPLACFAPLAECGGVRLISLQKGPGVDQLAGLGERFPVVDLGMDFDEASGPFMDTAAAMMNFDLVVTSDSAVAHLAGALGVPVWVALPFVPDWRWLLDRGDSPWYPTMRLFRQPRLGDWQSVFEQIRAALAERAGAG